MGRQFKPEVPIDSVPVTNRATLIKASSTEIEPPPILVAVNENKHIEPIASAIAPPMICRRSVQFTLIQGWAMVDNAALGD